MIEKANIKFLLDREAKRRNLSPAAKKIAQNMFMNIDIRFVKQDNFSVVLLFKDGTTFMGLGVSKRRPDDYDNDNIGYNQALVRAVKNVFDSEKF